MIGVGPRRRHGSRTIAGLGVAALVLTMGGSAPAGAASLVVDDDNVECASAPYHTINAALAAAEPGDDIVLCAGTYAEQVVLSETHPIHGIPNGFTLPVIAPTSLPRSIPAIAGGNPVAAAIIVSNAGVLVENVVIDLSGYQAAACSPITAGVYLQNARGTLRNTTLRGAAVPGRPDCDSGVGLLVESGTIDTGMLGGVKEGRSVVAARVMTFQGNQRAAIAAFGTKTVVRVVEALVEGDGRAAPFVQHGFQFSAGARGKLQDVRMRDLGTSVPGSLSSGLLVYGSDRVRARRLTLERVQVGAFFFGNRNRVAGGSFTDVASDGVVALGGQNRVLKTDIVGAAVDGVFLGGDQNLVRGGGFSDMPIGIWDYTGVGNRASQIEFLRVPEFVRIGGVRDLAPDAATPFTLTCASAVECDDGNPCTTDACESGGTCSNTILADGLPCDDANVCDGPDTCVGGVCTGTTPLVCTDGNECTADGCDPVLGCQFTALPDGTACTGGTCMGGLCM